MDEAEVVTAQMPENVMKARQKGTLDALRCSLLMSRKVLHDGVVRRELSRRAWSRSTAKDVNVRSHLVLRMHPLVLFYFSSQVVGCSRVPSIME